MKVETIHMSNLLDKCDDIYKVSMIAAQRAKQIIEDRFVPIEENEEVEDSIEFELPEIRTYVNKPEVVALDEFLEGKLEWRSNLENQEKSD